jgi:hypothetical protein
MYNAVSGETITYTYDSLNRLATAAGSGWGEQYGLIRSETCLIRW